MTIDTVRYVATPEGCEIELRVAGPVARARAWLIDFAIRFALWLALVLALGPAGDFGMGLLLVAGFALEWFYPVLFEVYRNGQTPGKRASGLAVVHDDGRSVGWSAAFLRNTLRAIDFLPLCYATGFVASLCNAGGKRLGDLAAGTVVVYRGGRIGRPPHAVGATSEVGSEAPPFVLSRDEQLAIIEFSQRAALLTDERTFELAAVAAPLTGGMHGEAARSRLLRIGNFLLGGGGSGGAR